MPRPIELLSPARDLTCGLAALRSGADAVYIGAPRFGARAAAGNSVEDIARLCREAHQYEARVYATVNTIFFDEELEACQRLVGELCEAGVDALIVQDMALLEMDLPPVPLHASTQMDNRTAADIRRLHALGIEQAVVARELSLGEIRAIHEAVPTMRLEAFVHGALCVSYSGRCYASQHCFRRSANRGECAQFCRLPFEVHDAQGVAVPCGPYPLSLRDMNRSLSLEEMMDAGVSSFKIEGRLKDAAYVRNVTAHYRRAIDRILLRREADYCRSSLGDVTFGFEPDPERTFSRGYTDYFLHGRRQGLASMQTPKSRGQEVGHVKEVRQGCITVSGTASFANGDGLCFLGADGELQGFRVNRAEGNHLYPAQMPPVRRGDTLWRSFDQHWERLMAHADGERRIPMRLTLSETTEGFRLTLTRQDGTSWSDTFPCPHELACSPQDDSIRTTLAKVGSTPYSCTGVELRLTQPWFIPRSLLAESRRRVTTAEAPRMAAWEATRREGEDDTSTAPTRHVDNGFVTLYPASRFPVPHAGAQGGTAANVSNHLAKRFCERHGMRVGEPALELTGRATPGMALMTCRYCLRYELGLCPTHQGAKSPYRAPYYLLSRDGRRFRLEFDCQRCQMTLHEA